MKTRNWSENLKGRNESWRIIVLCGIAISGVEIDEEEEERVLLLMLIEFD